MSSKEAAQTKQGNCMYGLGSGRRLPADQTASGGASSVRSVNWAALVGGGDSGLALGDLTHSTGDVVGLLLDLGGGSDGEGSLSVHRADGVKVGVLAEGLSPPLCWCVDLGKGGAVRIHGSCGVPELCGVSLLRTYQLLDQVERWQRETDAGKMPLAESTDAAVTDCQGRVAQLLQLPGERSTGAGGATQLEPWMKAQRAVAAELRFWQGTLAEFPRGQMLETARGILQSLREGYDSKALRLGVEAASGGHGWVLFRRSNTSQSTAAATAVTTKLWSDPTRGHGWVEGGEVINGEVVELLGSPQTLGGEFVRIRHRGLDGEVKEGWANVRYVEARVAPQFNAWSTHIEVVSSAGMTTVTRVQGSGACRSAMCRDYVMTSGQHYTEWVIGVCGSRSPFIGVVRHTYKPEEEGEVCCRKRDEAKDGSTVTRDCFFGVVKGKAYPHCWAVPDGGRYNRQPAVQGDRVGLLLNLDDGGSLTVFRNREKLGQIVSSGLVGPYCWCVDLGSKDASVQLLQADSAPEQEPPPPPQCRGAGER